MPRTYAVYLTLVEDVEAAATHVAVFDDADEALLCFLRCKTLAQALKLKTMAEAGPSEAEIGAVLTEDR